MPRRVQEVIYARSFEAIETAPGQYEHVIHDGSDAPSGSVSGIGRAPEVIGRLREFLGPVPVHEENLSARDLLGLHVLVGDVVGVTWERDEGTDWFFAMNVHLADGRKIRVEPLGDRLDVEVHP